MKIDIQQKVLKANEEQADKNRRYFKEKNVFVLNMMSSPGSGKTQILCKTIEKIEPNIKTGVIVGDICTSSDAKRLEKNCTRTIQINTDKFGGDCHLSANLIFESAKKIGCEDLDLLIVENIGNLVCPAEFDIGEDTRVVVLSVTEGEDKPLKYPLMFRLCYLAILNKIDLLPYLDFDINLVVNNIRKIHPHMPVHKISAKTEQGFTEWIDWIKIKVFEKTG